VGDDKPCDQKQPVLAKPGLGRFQGSPAYETENDAKKRQSGQLAPSIKLFFSLAPGLGLDAWRMYTAAPRCSKRTSSNQRFHQVDPAPLRKQTILRSGRVGHGVSIEPLPSILDRKSRPLAGGAEAVSSTNASTWEHHSAADFAAWPMCALIQRPFSAIDSYRTFANYGFDLPKARNKCLMCMEGETHGKVGRLHAHVTRR
jgi:hypothetical protein